MQSREAALDAKHCHGKKNLFPNQPLFGFSQVERQSLFGRRKANSAMQRHYPVCVRWLKGEASRRDERIANLKAPDQVQSTWERPRHLNMKSYRPYFINFFFTTRNFLGYVNPSPLKTEAIKTRETEQSHSNRSKTPEENAEIFKKTLDRETSGTTTETQK